jgi:hypothetical protein
MQRSHSGTGCRSRVGPGLEAYAKAEMNYQDQKDFFLGFLVRALTVLPVFVLCFDTATLFLDSSFSFSLPSK